MHWDTPGLRKQLNMCTYSLLLNLQKETKLSKIIPSSFQTIRFPFPGYLHSDSFNSVAIQTLGYLYNRERP